MNDSFERIGTRGVHWTTVCANCATVMQKVIWLTEPLGPGGQCPRCMAQLNLWPLGKYLRQLAQEEAQNASQI